MPILASLLQGTPNRSCNVERFSWHMACFRRMLFPSTSGCAGKGAKVDYKDAREIMMATASHSGKSATVSINPHNQNLDSVHRIVAHILDMAGCRGCGRLALLRIDFLGDPPPELGK